ncbi:hypothetical protein [Bradyrhizobium sp. SZCCHNRI3043]|uniref:hypothetical protein n=1 Tax=Bradyrhizobium sp. SZCCHNRI3043 TaxID=3057292 RepID=UPI0028EDCC81|nr:hypothetical protein [Bradyrhizobium sp. SZCCHNRI3043]
MSDQKPERASLGVADTTGMASASVDLMPKTSAFPDAVDLAVPSIATVAPPMIAPDHEAPAADRPGIDPKAAIVEAVTAPEPQAEANKSEIKTEMTADTEIGTISVKPVKPEQVKVEALTAEPEKIEPAKIQAAKPERAKPEPARLDLVKSDKGKSDKVKPELTKAQAAGGNLAATGKVEAAASSSAAKSPSTILDLIRTEPVKSEPIKTAAAGELLKVETPKLSMLAANAPKVGPMAAAAPKPETAIKPDAPIKSVAATKTEAVVRPEPAAKSETVARPETVAKSEAKSEPVAKQASAAKPEVSATRPVTPVQADAGPATRAGAFAAVDKAAAWAKAKFKTEPFKFDATSKSASAAATAASATAAGAALPPPQPGQAPRPHGVNGRLGLPAMAAILLLSMIVGGVAGGLVTAKFVTRSGGGDVADAAAGEAADATLGATVARIDNDVAALKASLDQTNQTSLVELNKSAERLDRLEKILGDLSTKSSAKPSELQRLSEAVDRLRAAQASATAQAPARDSAASVPQAVGAINAAAPPAGVASRADAARTTEAARTEAARAEASRAEPARAETAHPEPSRTEATKPKVVEGWVLRDVGRGGALIEGRGGLYEVYAGDPVPGLGKVDAIRKQDGRWVVVTTKGLVVAR